MLTCIPFFTVNAQASAWILAVYSVLWSRLWGVFWIAKGLQKNLGNFVACDPSVTVASNIVVAVLFMLGWGGHLGLRVLVPQCETGSSTRAARRHESGLKSAPHDDRRGPAGLPGAAAFHI